MLSRDDCWWHCMRWRVVKLLRGWLILVMTWHRQVTIKPHQIGHNFWRGTGAVWDCPVDSCGIIHRQVTTWGCGRSMIPYVELSYLKDPWSMEINLVIDRGCWHTLPPCSFAAWYIYRHWLWKHEAAFNSSSPGQNGRHFTDDIFNCIFVNEKFCILIQISMTFVPKGPVVINEHWLR